MNSNIRPEVDLFFSKARLKNYTERLELDLCGSRTEHIFGEHDSMSGEETNSIRVSEDSYDWSVAVFGVNEAQTIGRCISSIKAACEDRTVHVCILLNGTTDNSEEVVRMVPLPLSIRLDVVNFARADKAQVINEFLYEIRPEAQCYFFVDAYTKVGRGSLMAMESEMALNKHPHIVTGIPINGRSSQDTIRKTLNGGAINGQLYAMRKTFIESIVARGFRIPLKMYRGDPLLGSMACHNLDPTNNPWDKSRISGLRDAPFEISPLSIWRFSDIKRQFKREIRQARGRFENEAVRALIAAGGYESLPSHSDDMISAFLEKGRLAPRSIREWLFMRLALWGIKSRASPRTMA